MSPVAVVTDTTQYLPADLVRQNDLHLVSLYVRFGDELERESAMPDFQAFYDRLRSAKELPTTSQPSVGDFLAVYEPLIERGADIVSIHLSGGISGTVRSAEQARDRLVERGVSPAGTARPPTPSRTSAGRSSGSASSTAPTSRSCSSGTPWAAGPCCAPAANPRSPPSARWPRGRRRVSR